VTSEVQLLGLLERVMDFHQSSLMEYLFVADLKHREIEKELKSKQGKGALGKRVLELDNHLEQEFTNVSKKICEFLREYFSKDYCSKRSKIPLRVSIKVIANNEIVSLRRFPENRFEDVQSLVSENSAFDALRSGEKFYFCNSIPKEILNGYKNNRIDVSKAKEYVQRLINGEIKPIQDDIDEEWVKCWNQVTIKLSGDKVEPPRESCYKSTIALPIFFNAESLTSNEFKTFFHLDRTEHLNAKKLILGYLCLDHPLENYFQQETDVGIGYIFSKILSLYMIFQLQYTQYSTIYYRALESIADS
jgi:YHS domain-containing protein